MSQQQQQPQILPAVYPQLTPNGTFETPPEWYSEFSTFLPPISNPNHQQHRINMYKEQLYQQQQYPLQKVAIDISWEISNSWQNTQRSIN